MVRWCYRFLLLTTVLFLTVNNSNSVNGDLTTTGAILALINLANEYGTPFAKTAVDRIHGNIFGNTTGRASRTTDIIIFNKSSKNFKLNSNHCEHGGYSTDLFPEYEIPSKTSSVFGVECHGFMSGVKCTTRYQSAAEDDGTTFFITTDNPYGGKNSATESGSLNLKVTPTVGKGNNNQVRFIIEDWPIHQLEPAKTYLK